MNVKNKVFLITGGAGGLGSFMSIKLVNAGAIVYVLDLDKEKGTALINENKDKNSLHFICMDLTSEDSWQKAVNEVIEKENKIDVLVNNAGINIRKDIEDISLNEWKLMMDVNVGSVFLGTKFVLPIMKKQKDGSIINMSSVCGLVGHKFTPEAYTTTKGAVTLLTKSIASRYAKFGIRCNSIHPSTVNTPFIDELFKDPEKKAQRYGEVPLGRLCSKEDVANAVFYLASEEASFINGLALCVDGGVTCY